MSKAGWGYIGVPNGFQHISDGYTANSNINVVDNRICHPDFADESIFAVIYDTAVTKSRDSKQLMTYFAEYRFAREIERTREGSFYGSYVAFPRVAPEHQKDFEFIIKLLNCLSDEVNKKFITNYKFNTEFSKDNSVLKINGLEPKLSGMVDSLQPRAVEKINKRQAIVYSDNPAEVFFNSKELYEQYSVIYSVSNKNYLNQIVKDNNIIVKTIDDLKKETDWVIEERARLEEERKRLAAEEKAKRDEYLAQKISDLEREVNPQLELLKHSEHNFGVIQELSEEVFNEKSKQLKRKKERISTCGETEVDLTDIDMFADYHHAQKEKMSSRLGESIILLKELSSILESEYKSLNHKIRQTNPEFFESEEFIDASAYSNKNNRNELDNQGFNRPRPQPVEYDNDYESSGFRKSTLIIIAVLLVAIIAGAFYLVFNAKELFSKDDEYTGQTLSVDGSGKVVEDASFQDGSNSNIENDLVLGTTQVEVDNNWDDGADNYPINDELTPSFDDSDLTNESQIDENDIRMPDNEGVVPEPVAMQ